MQRHLLALAATCIALASTTHANAQANAPAAAQLHDDTNTSQQRPAGPGPFDRLSEGDTHSVQAACELAGNNHLELLTALINTPDEQLPAIIFLITNMPQRDLETVTAEFLLENVALAYEAWKNAPWHDQVTEDQFFQYILPFASLNERRDDWRRDFYDQLREECWKFDNTLDATNWLNDNLNDHFEVYFHATLRPKPDQSPYESIEAGYASCTGLSILLTDACRAVGIPARIVGVPLWTEIQGNHNWVEVFHDRWYNVGGTNSDVRDDDWVNDRCRNMTDPDQWEHAIYAASFLKNKGHHFPLVWDLEIDYVPALNVTRFYSEAKEVTIDIGDGNAGNEVFIYWQDELVARATPEEGANEVTVQLAGNTTYRIVTPGLGGNLDESELTLE